MVDKVTLTNLENLQNEGTVVAAINANNQATIIALNNTLSRDGTSPNSMGATLDMNSQSIINLPEPAFNTEPIRKIDFDEFATALLVGGQVTLVGGAGAVVTNASGVISSIVGIDGQFLKANASGTSPSFVTLSAANLSNGTIGTGQIVLSTAPTINNILTINGAVPELRLSGATSSSRTFQLFQSADIVSLGAAGFSSPVTLNLVSGNLGTKTINIAPTPVTTNKGLSITQSGPLTGSHGTSQIDFNSIDITSEAIRLTPGTTPVNGLRLTWQSGGANSGGSRTGLLVQLNLAAAGDASLAARDHVAIIGAASATASDGGTLGAERGAIWASDFSAILYSGATNIAAVSVGECQFGMNTGSSALGRMGWNMVAVGDLQATSDLDFAYGLSATAGTGQLKSGMVFHAGNGQAPVLSTGTLFKSVGTSTVANCLDFSSYNFTGYIFSFPTYSVAGTGEVSTREKMTAKNNTAIPAGGTAAYLWSVTPNYGIFFGSGAPSVSAAKGSIYSASNGTGATDRAYINTNGTTAWTAIVTNDGGMTGTGEIVRASTPTLVTPILGVATATTINKVTITQPATGSTLTIDNGVTLRALTTLNLQDSAPSTITFQGNGTYVHRTSTDTLTNKTLTSPTLTGATLTNSVSVGLNDSSANINMSLLATSSTLLTAPRSITFDVGDKSHTIQYGTVANTITFPSVASYTVAGLSVAQTFTATQSISAASTNLVLGGNAAPQVVFQPSSGATKNAQFYQQGDNFLIGDAGVATRMSMPLATGAVTFLAGTAIPAGGTAGSGIMFSTTANFGTFFGSGVPTLSAAKGSLYLRSDGSSTTTRAYINTDGGTTWTSITTAA